MRTAHAVPWLVVVGLFISATAVFGENLIINGSFEMASGNPDNGDGSTYIDGWTVIGQQGPGYSIDYLCGYWQAADGTCSIDLNGCLRGGMRQRLSTVPGARYNVQFWISGNPFGNGPEEKTLQVVADNESELFSFIAEGTSVDNMGWKRCIWSFTADGISTDLTFLSMIDGCYGPVLDNVSVELVTKYSGGTGVPEDPYQIWTAEEMNSIGLHPEDWSRCFKLMADIDMAAYTGTMYNRIGFDGDNVFNGSFDGNGHVIRNLIYKTASSSQFVGLFGYTSKGAIIKNLGLIDVDISATGGHFGALAGQINDDTTITSCYSTGSVIGSDSSIGGLVGAGWGTMTSCYSTCTVKGDYNVGGLVGSSAGTMISCYSNGTVNGNFKVGGLAGWNDATMTNCFSASSVSGNHSIGGLIGNHTSGTITSGTITSCYATGSVIGTSDSIGGLVGTNSGLIQFSYATGLVTGPWSSGGLVGENHGGSISGCYSTSEVNGERISGGLVGFNGSNCSITDSYATGNVTGDWKVGGLVGENSLSSSSISGCFALGNISGGFNSGSVGGLCAENYGTVINSYAVGNVISFAGLIGGLCGHNQGMIKNSYATGVTSGSSVGGICAGNYGEIVDSFWDKDTSGCTTSDGGTGKTTDEMKTLSTFTSAGWDFATVWMICEGKDYPHLQWEGIICQPYSGGSGTSEDPYKISTIADWQELMDKTEDWNQHFILTADLNMAGVNLTPMGTEGNPFIGVFDGNGHVIRNVVMNLPDNWHVGLFGYLGSSGQIKNLGVIDANIQGCYHVGGLVGQNGNATIDSCYATGAVSGTGSVVGGLVGYNAQGTITSCYARVEVNGTGDSVGGLVGNNHATIDSCCATGAVSGTGIAVGGLVGQGDGTISSSYATGEVNGTSDNVGGLVGQNYGTITFCYATGAVSGNDRVGGLMGTNSHGTIDSCYARGEVNGTGNYIGGLVGINSGTVDFCYAVGAVRGVGNIGGLVGYNDGVFEGVFNSFWDTDTSGQATSIGGTGLSTAEMKTKNTFTNAGWDFGSVWMICEGKDYPHLLWEDFDCEPYSGGSGTPEDPYQIATPADWQELMSSSDDWDKHFILLADLDMSGVLLTPIAPDTVTEDFFQGIPFTGIFDGKDHSLRNVVVDLPDQDYVGLFGLLGPGGQIRDLALVDGAISGHSGVGGLCGKTSSGSVITDCYTAGSIHGTVYVGGLVGKNGEWDNPGGEISNCYATGPVSGNGAVGGLAGWNSGTVNGCYATGSADGQESIGGLAGYNLGTIEDSYATGAVTGSVRYIGGLVGWNDWGSISRVYATGFVQGTEAIGGLVGWNYSGTISGFWDTQTSGQSASDGGTGKTTAEMKQLSTFIDAGWDFVGETANGTEDTWKMPYDGYPELSWQSFGIPSVYFVDANLKAAVEAKLGITNPTADDMLMLTYLDARTRGIVSLVGLETAVNLTTLYLNQNAISDITPLSGLNKLTVLTLHSNNISDITPLAGLTKLYYLFLGSNKIFDISSLTGLSNLIYLYMPYNQINDFSALTGNTKFKEIYAHGNAVLTKDTYLSHIPAIRAGNPNLKVFQYDPGCQSALVGDLTQDCRVNLADLAALAENWLKCNHIYPEMCL